MIALDVLVILIILVILVVPLVDFGAEANPPAPQKLTIADEVVAEVLSEHKTKVRELAMLELDQYLIQEGFADIVYMDKPLPEVVVHPFPTPKAITVVGAPRRMDDMDKMRLHGYEVLAKRRVLDKQQAENMKLAEYKKLAEHKKIIDRERSYVAYKDYDEYT